MIKGSKMTEEQKNRISLGRKGKGIKNTNGFKVGDTPFNKGKKCNWTSERNKTNNPNKGMEKHWNWKGGNNTRTMRKKAPRPMPNNCEICGIPGSELKKGLCYEHNHKTGEFRGWVCGRCNTVMGMVDDNQETLLLIVKYLKNNATDTKWDLVAVAQEA